MRVIKLMVAAVGLLVLSPAYGHSLFVDCAQQAAEVRCVAGYSDGSKVVNVPYEVIGYDDELLFSGRTDPESGFSFTPSTEAYYILLDAGPGHVVEVDMADVQ